MLEKTRLAGPRLTTPQISAVLAPGRDPYDPGPLFYAVELQTYRPGAVAVGLKGLLSKPRLAPPIAVGVLESTDMLRASDAGYRTEAESAYGVLAYPPALSTAFRIDRTVTLNPSSYAVSAAWGTIELANLGRQYDRIARSRNSDSRPVRVLAGKKVYDDLRGIYLDPKYDTLTEVFRGVAKPWSLSEQTLSIPIRDPGALLERPYLTDTYAGTGRYEGTPDMIGRRKPRLRGGTSDFPVRECSPVWVDRLRNIAQVSDAPGFVFSVSEDADPTRFPFAGQVADLYVGSTPAGQYRWMSNENGLFIQLGSPSQGTITVDAVGFFPGGVQSSMGAECALHVMQIDMRLPMDNLDVPSFLGLRAAYPSPCGAYWDGEAEITAGEVVSRFLASSNARALPARNGRLRAWALRLPGSARPDATYTQDQIVSVAPTTLVADAGLSPPPYRWRVAYARAHTVQKDKVAVKATPEHRDFVSNEWRYAPWIDTALAGAYRNPTDPDPVETYLLSSSHAATLAYQIGTMWASNPTCYEVVLPTEYAYRHEVGDALTIAYPLDDLDEGRVGVIVGESMQSGQKTVTYRVLI